MFNRHGTGFHLKAAVLLVKRQHEDREMQILHRNRCVLQVFVARQDITLERRYLTGGSFNTRHGSSRSQSRHHHV